MIDLQAENKKLRIQEENDRQKIQHLLALTQPITEEVGLFVCLMAAGGLASYLRSHRFVGLMYAGHVFPRLSSWHSRIVSGYDDANPPDVHVSVDNAYFVRDGLAAASEESAHAFDAY